MSRHWMPLYIGDYLTATRHLSAAEHGAYLLLIMSYWDKGSLPSDERQIMRLTAMTDKEWRDSRDTLAEFFEPGWVHPRIDRELAEASEKYQRRSEAGRAGGLKRGKSKQNSSNASAVQEANGKQKNSNASSNAISNAPSKRPSKTEAGLNQPQPHSLRSSYPGDLGDSDLDQLAQGEPAELHGQDLSISARALAAIGRGRA
ncbi:YdaU family protein [Labrys sp. KB_33_2]|uniref:YdaU family protein n=1 Tax=Labrys sp. KB_33_2 TaxID=3237479 RepID=UPI003F91C732